MVYLKWLNANWQTILTTFTTIAGFITATITYIKTKNWNAVKSAVSEYVKEAEKLETAGVIKKEIVLAKMRTLCVRKRIKFNEEKVSALIESVVSLTKSVNAREKDKVAETEK